MQVCLVHPRFLRLVSDRMGHTFSSCSNTIEMEVRTLPAILTASVSLMGNSMTVIHDPVVTSVDTIIRKISDIGYEAVQWDTSDVDPDVSPSKAIETTRTVQIKLDGMFCGCVYIVLYLLTQAHSGSISRQCPITLNAALSTLKLTSFTPLSLSTPITIITYTPSPTLTIRHIFSSLSSAPAFTPKIFVPPTPYARSRALAAQESAHLARLFFISFCAAVPTFVVGVMGMTALPRTNKFRMWCETPIWGGAARAVVILWALASVVQFGVGRYVASLYFLPEILALMAGFWLDGLEFSTSGPLGACLVGRPPV